MSPEDKSPLRIFISYSRTDKTRKQELEKHLRGMGSASIKSWSVDDISPGSDWRHEIEQALAAADVALLLISADFMTSPFNQDTELPALLARQVKEGLRVIPILLRPCSWQLDPRIESLQALPRDGKPIGGRALVERDATYVEVCEVLLTLAARPKQAAESATTHRSPLGGSGFAGHATTTHSCTLIVDMSGPITVPEALAGGIVIRIPQPERSDLSTRLRALPIDKAAWQDAMAIIDDGIRQAVATQAVIVHVLAQAPYPAATFLGRRLDDLARAQPLCTYRFDGVTKQWTLMSSPGGPTRPEPVPYYREPEPDAQPARQDVILALEGKQAISDEPLTGLAKQRRAGIVAFRPLGSNLLGGAAEALGAMVTVQRALRSLHRRNPSVRLHIVATAPAGLLVELGRSLSPTVYRSAIVYQYDAVTGTYAPVLDLISRQVVAD